MTETPKRALVIGASGAIGQALTMALGNRLGIMNVVTLSRSADGMELRDPGSLGAFVAEAAAQGPFDIILIATGALSIDGHAPEKSITRLDGEAMAAQFAVNTIGPAVMLSGLMRAVPKDRRAVIGVLSARVGSIGDNRLGGWVSYRAAKAALNQIVRTTAIELARTRPQAILAAVHPGTVRGPLTEAYAGRHPTVPPAEAAENILRVLDGLDVDDSGGFFDWKGEVVPW